MSDTRKIIDYTFDENAVGMRDALYAAIHDRVTAHIEAKKQEIAQNLITQHDEEVEYEDDEEFEEDDLEEDEEDLEESVEELDELSKSTLRSYKDKADKDWHGRRDRDHDLESTRGGLRDLVKQRYIHKPSAAPLLRPDASVGLKRADPELHKHLTGILDKLTTDSKAEKAKIKTRRAGIERAETKLKKRNYGKKLGEEEVSPFSSDYKSQTDKPGEKAGFTSKKISTGTVYSRKPAKDEPATPSKKK
jgi:hypothetical protein